MTSGFRDAIDGGLFHSHPRDGAPTPGMLGTRFFSFFFERITKKTVKKMGKASQNDESYVKCVKMRAQLPEEAPLAKTVTRASCALRKGRL